MEDFVTTGRLAERDFARARRREVLGRFVARLRGRPGRGAANRLACFGGSRRAGSFRREFETVGLEEISGSVGRCRDFDPDFLPVCSCLGERWTRIARAFREGRMLPPVELYKVCERYFVLDGNHRVSVARYRGMAAIDAVVTKFASP